MSRFSRLEFGKDRTSDFQTEVVKDESFYFNEAGEAFESGRFDSALRNFAKVLEFNPKNAAAWNGQVRALIELGEYHEARVWSDKALESFEDDPELLAARAVALARLGDAHAALAYSDASMGQRGETPYLWIARGDVLLARGENRAEYCFQKAFAMAPRDWVARWLVSRAHSFYDKFSLALKYAEEALHMNSSNAAVWLQVGHCQLALGLAGPAEKSFTQARQLDPNCLAADAGLARISRDSLLTRFHGVIRRIFRI